MHCPRCSVLNIAGAKFCSKCGIPLEVEFSLSEADGTGNSRSVSSPKSTTSVKSRYEILKEIKNASTGTIYLARDKVAQKEVILKRYNLTSQKSDNLDVFLRKSIEIQALNHLNVISIYHVGHDEEGPYLVTEKFDGKTLADFLEEKNALSIEKTAKIARGIASALAFSHKKGIYHGVLTPNSVLINSKLDSKVTDFCLSFENSDETAQYYLAPEQRQRKGYLDFRVDIYSLGCLVYKMSTGKDPKIIDLSLLPGKLQKVVQKATEIQREDRFANMEDFFEALNNLDDDDDSHDLLTSNTCPMCGAYNGKESKFCSHCGAGLIEECPSCKAENRIGQKSCLRCGLNFTSYKTMQTKILHARSLYNQGNIEEALNETSLILQMENSNEEALRLKEKFESHLRELEQEIAVIKALIEEGVYKSALQKIEGLSKKFPTSNQVGSAFKLLIEELHKAQYNFSLSGLFDLVNQKDFTRVLVELQGILQTTPSPSKAFRINEFMMQNPVQGPPTSMDGTDSGTGSGTSTGSGTMAWHRFDLDEFEDLDSLDDKKKDRKLLAKAKRFFNRYEFGNAAKICKKILSEDKRHSGARTLLKKALQKGKTLKQLAKKAREYEEYEDFKKALAIWKKALLIAPKHKGIREKINRLKGKLKDDFEIDSFLGDSDDFIEEDLYEEDSLQEEGWEDGDIDDDFDPIEEEEEDKTDHLLKDAQGALKNSEFGEAYRLAKAVLDLDWENEKAKRIQEIAREKGIQLKKIIEQAKEAEEAANFEKAASFWKEAYYIAPTNNTIGQKFQAMREKASSEKQIPILLKDAQRYIDQKEYRDALILAQDILKMDPSNLQANQLRTQAQDLMDEAQTLLLKGRKLLVEKEFEQAIAILEKALEFFPSSREAKELLGLAREKYEAGETDFKTIDMEILLGTHTFPSEAKAPTEGWDDEDDDFVGAKNKKEVFMSRPSARNAGKSAVPGTGQKSPSPTGKQKPLQEVDDASFFEQISALTGGASRTGTASKSRPESPSESSEENSDEVLSKQPTDPAIDLGDEFSSLRRQREQALKDDSTTTFSSTPKEIADTLDNLFGDSKGSGSLTADPLSSFDPEDQITEKIPRPGSETPDPTESDKMRSYSALDFLLGGGPKSDQEIGENSGTGLMDSPSGTHEANSSVNTEGYAKDEVFSLIEEVESKVTESTQKQEAPLILGPPVSEEDSLRSAINKAIDEVDQADFADTDKINVNEIGAALHARGSDDDGISLEMMGATGEIHRPTAISKMGENMATSEIDFMFSNMSKEGEPDSDSSNAGSGGFDDFFSKMEKTPEGPPPVPSVLGKKDSFPPSKTQGEAYDDLEDADTERIDRNLLGNFAPETPPSPIPQVVTSKVSSPSDPTEGDSSNLHDSLDNLFGGPVSPPTPVEKTEEPFDPFGGSSGPSLTDEEEEAFDLFGSSPLPGTGRSAELPAFTTSDEQDSAGVNDGDSTGFLDVLEKALGNEAQPASAGSPQGGRSSEINAFMDDYAVTSELDPMNLKEATIRREKRGTARIEEKRANFPTEDMDQKEGLFAIDWSPDEDSEGTPSSGGGSGIWGGSRDSAMTDMVQDLFPGMESQTPKAEKKASKSSSRSTIKIFILFLLGVIALAGLGFGFLWYNYNQGTKLLKINQYEKAYQKFQQVEFDQFVGVVGRKEFFRNCKEAAVGIGKKFLKEEKTKEAKKYFELAKKYASNLMEIKLYLQLVKFHDALQLGDQKLKNGDFEKSVIDGYRKAKEFANSSEEKDLAQKKETNCKNLWLKDILSAPGKTETALKGRIREISYISKLYPQDKEVAKALSTAQYELYHYLYIQALSRALDSLKVPFDYMGKALEHRQDKTTELCHHFAQRVMADAESLHKSQAYDQALAKLDFLRTHEKFLKIHHDELEKKIHQIRYELYLSLAEKAQRAQNWSDVIKNFKEALQFGPETLKILSALQDAKGKLETQARAYELSDDWDKAVSIYNILVKHFPEDKEIKQKWDNANFQMYKQRADEEFKELHWNKSRISYQKALGHNPKEKQPPRLSFLNAKSTQNLFEKFRQHIKRADKLVKKREWKEAIKAFIEAKKLMGLYSKECDWLRNKIETCEKEWNFLQENAYKKHFEAGISQLRTQEPYKAAKHFKDALYYKPNDQEARRYLFFSQKLKDMVYVKAGLFLMGVKDNNLDQDQTPQNKIFQRAFYIDKYEVTNKQYRKFLEFFERSGDHSQFCHPKEPKNKDHTPKFWNDQDFNQDDQPVVGVDWYDVYAYARFVGKELPSEEEWEKAARGTNGRRWPWGDQWDPNAINHYSTGHNKSVSVGSFPLGRSDYGCYDMAGNVWEWTKSIYKPYRNSLFKIPDEKRNFYILRGGSWNDYGEGYLADKRLTETTFRYPKSKKTRENRIGFRCVIAPLR